MKIVVIGGTGLIGSQLISFLDPTQHQVIAASPSTGVDTITGKGLDEVFQDAQVVVDVTNSPSFESDYVLNFFKTSTEHIVAAAQKAGVQHLIALSIVGTQKLHGSGYFKAKQVQEDLIRNSGIGFTIVQATQFFEFAGGIAYMSTLNEKVYLPTAYIQPIASKEVAGFLAKTVLAEPANVAIEIGGPEKFRMNDWIAQYAKSTNQKLDIVGDSNALYSGYAITDDTLVTGDNAVFIGEICYKDWIVENIK